MKDILIKFNCTNPWGMGYSLDIERIKKYKDWIKLNMEKDTYHFPRAHKDRVFFMNEDELTFFTLVHGTVYEIIGKDQIDMTQINRMLWNATIMEKHALARIEKDNKDAD